MPLFLFDKGEYLWYNVTIINGEHTKTQNKQNERKMFYERYVFMEFVFLGQL